MKNKSILGKITLAFAVIASIMFIPSHNADFAKGESSEFTTIHLGNSNNEFFHGSGWWLSTKLKVDQDILVYELGVKGMDYAGSPNQSRIMPIRLHGESQEQTYVDFENINTFSYVYAKLNKPVLLKSGKEYRIRSRVESTGYRLSKSNKGNFTVYSNGIRIDYETGAENEWDTNPVVFSFKYKLPNDQPNLTITTPTDNPTLSAVEGHNLLNIRGFVQDPDNDNVTVTATLQGRSTSTVVSNTNVQRQFDLQFDLFDFNNLENGTHQVRVVADDGNGGIATATFNVTIVEFLSDNKYVLIDELLMMLTKYEDIEGDSLHDYQFRINHNPNHFENASRTNTSVGVTRHSPFEQTRAGVINRNDTWTSPSNLGITKGPSGATQAWYTSFQTVGHYEIYYRAKDNPKDDDAFDEFRYWSRPSPALNVYVHRKPVAHFEPYMNTNTGEVLIIDNAYDLDSYSQGERGIKEKEWSYRQVGTTNWISGKPTTLNRTQDHEIRQIVTDFQGETDEYIERVDRVTEFPNQPPIPGFTHESPYFVGDTIQLTSTARDLDGDPLTYRYEIVSPSGTITTDTNEHPIFPAAEIGTYTVTQYVTDGHHPEVFFTDTIDVMDLVYGAEINHIQNWINYYNDVGRDLSTFLAGEPFDVLATTSPNATNVEITFDFPTAQKRVPTQFLYNPGDNPFPNFRHSFALEPISSSEWSIQAWRKYWVMIPDGTYNATLRVTFENGEIRVANYQIVIRDHILYNKQEGYSNRDL